MFNGDWYQAVLNEFLFTKIEEEDIGKIACHTAEAIALKDNNREAIGEIQLHTIDYVLKNSIDRIGYCMAS